MRQWADQYDCAQREKQMLLRRKGFTADGPGEALAREALDDEDRGKLEDAKRIWRQSTPEPGKGKTMPGAWWPRNT